MIRTYLRRNRERNVEELDDVRAFRPAHDTPEVPETDRLPHEGLRSFERSGWRFLDREAVEDLPSDAGETARVIRDQDRIVLARGRLTAKFRDGVSLQDVERLVLDAGCRIVQTLPVARNTYVLEPSDPRHADPFTVANLLAQWEETEFAEPEFIEAIASR